MKVLLTLSLLLLIACGQDRVKVVTNGSRISDLERRMALNEQLDNAQSALIAANAAAIAAEQSAREAADLALSADLQQEIADRAAADSHLQSLLSAEASARASGDLLLASGLAIEIANRIIGDAANSAALGAVTLNQSIINFGVNYKLSVINNKLSVINGRLSSLESRMDNAESSISQLESDAAQLALDMASLEASLQAEIDLVAASAAATQAQLNAEGVKVFKCNSPSSTERILKINGKFYAAMNRVTTRSAQVITGSSSQTITIPKLCKNNGNEIKLPQSNGNCKHNETQVSGTGVSTVIPSYSTSNITVVDSVKIAIDILADGSYSTTDGGPACSFSISGGGSSQSGLVQVQ